MKSCRVLIIDSEKVWRGGQQQILTLIEGLAGRHQVLLACPQESPLAARAASAGVAVEEFGQRSEFSLSAHFRLRALIRDWKPDIVHFNTPKPVLVGCLAARQFHPRPRCVASRRVVFPLSSSLSRYKYSHLLDLTLTVSDSIRSLLVESGVPAEKVRTVHEGVEIAPDEGAEQQPDSGRNRPLVVGTVAHLSHEKGQDTLIRSAARLGRTFPDVRFVIVGDGEDRPSLEKLARELAIEERVEFWGFRADADSLTASFDVFCLCSLSEGLSSAILAAMAAGLPIIASRVGGNPELVQEGLNGFLVPPANAEALAVALRKLLESAKLRAAMGQASRRRAEREFSLEQKILRTLASYQELLEAASLR